MINRRTAVKALAGIAGTGLMSGLPALAGRKRWFKIGACDWSINSRSEVKAMTVAKQIGLNGVQVSLGTVKNNMHLREKEVQAAYKKAASETGVAISSLAIGALNQVPYKTDPRTEEWVSDSIDAAQALGCKVVLLAFFSKGDLKDDPRGQQEVIRRLRRVAPKAERAGAYLGIESWLSAREHMDILEAVGSPNIKVYYDVANSNKMGYDIYEEIRWLGDHICEFHMKENGSLLGKGAVDFQKVRQAMDDIGYNGWMQIEGAIPKGGDMLESYVANRKFLQQLFPEKT